MAFSGKSRLVTLFTPIAIPYVAFAHPYPEWPDTRVCSEYLGRPLSRPACQAAVDNLPRGSLPSIFTIRRHTATNNFIQVPVHYVDAESRPSCTIAIDMDGHSLDDQFVFVPWDEIRKMAQLVVDLCVGFTERGGFITYGVGRTLESLVHPTSYWGNHADEPRPASVWQPDGTVDSVAIPSVPVTNEYSKFCPTALYVLLVVEENPNHLIVGYNLTQSQMYLII